VDTDGIPLREALSSLRRELYGAVDSARDEELRFRIESIEVELQIVATASGGATADAGLWQVVRVGGRAGRERSSTHRVKLSLTPSQAGGGDAYVGDEVPERPR
jgi:Trypsin-co-occurring domain 2